MYIEYGVLVVVLAIVSYIGTVIFEGSLPRNLADEYEIIDITHGS
jgi:Flp pilus assembly pilin Flp